MPVFWASINAVRSSTCCTLSKMNCPMTSKWNYKRQSRVPTHRMAAAVMKPGNDHLCFDPSTLDTRFEAIYARQSRWSFQNPSEAPEDFLMAYCLRPGRKDISRAESLLGQICPLAGALPMGPHRRLTCDTISHGFPTMQLPEACMTAVRYNFMTMAK